jgi:Protein of unknown function (DUF3105)
VSARVAAGDQMSQLQPVSPLRPLPLAAALSLLACTGIACSGSNGSPSSARDAAQSEDAAAEDATVDEPDAAVDDPEASAPPDAAVLAPGESPPEGTPPYDPRDGQPRPEICTSCGDCIEKLAVAPAVHVTGGVDYQDIPPVGGAHDPCWTTYGVHQEEVPDERWVHNLEHGGVVLLHHCSDCADDIAAIEAFVADQPIAVSTPYAALPARFAIVSWGARIVSDCYDPEAFAQFFDLYSKRAPEGTSAPPPPSCPP